MKKKFPNFRTDVEAESFLDKDDLSEYDFSEMVPMHFEIRKKDKSISIRLPDQLLKAVKNSAKNMGIPYQRFMRMAIEQAIKSK